MTASTGFNGARGDGSGGAIGGGIKTGGRTGGSAGVDVARLIDVRRGTSAIGRGRGGIGGGRGGGENESCCGSYSGVPEPE